MIYYLVGGDASAAFNDACLLAKWCIYKNY